MRRIMIAAGLCALLSGAALAQVTVGGGEQTGGHDGHQASLSTGEVALIEKRLAEYDAAFNAKDLEKLGTFYHPDVTIYEGGGVDNGWAAYRDGHLGPELKAFENLQFGHRDITVSILPGGQSAYVRSEYFLKAKMRTREIDSSGLATYVLIKGENGWKIRHSHTSSRPRRPAGG
jgi:ketosteroid isomerase-like protein